MGVELNRKRARRRDEAGGGESEREGALRLTHTKEKAVAIAAAQSERIDLRRVEEGEKSERFSREEGEKWGQRFHLVPLVCPRTLGGSPVGIAGNLAPIAEKDGERGVSRKKSSKLTQQDISVTWREEEGGKWRHDS